LAERAPLVERGAVGEPLPVVQPKLIVGSSAVAEPMVLATVDCDEPCQLARKVKDYDPKADTSLIDAAYHLATQAHVLQRRDNGDPYITHPIAVADILAGYHLDVASIVTALLHDVVEDTPVKLVEVEQKFGKEVAANPTAPSRRRTSASWCWP
jgi:HD domain